ncbi:MAG: hypothetical protein ACPGGK_12975 [Pikeienuella sp.]
MSKRLNDYTEEEIDAHYERLNAKRPRTWWKVAGVVVLVVLYPDL